jgi:hypothetical protein
MKALLALTSITGILLTGCVTNAYPPSYSYNRYQPSYQPSYENQYQPSYENQYQPSYQPSYRTTSFQLNVQSARQRPNYRPNPYFYQERQVNAYRTENFCHRPRPEGTYVVYPTAIQCPDGRVVPRGWN